MRVFSFNKNRAFEYLLHNVQALASPSRGESDVLCTIVDFFTKLGRFCGRGATVWSGNTIFSPNNLTYDHLMKIEWLGANKYT